MKKLIQLHISYLYSKLIFSKEEKTISAPFFTHSDIVHVHI